jgi:hypothetical protein
MKPNEKGPIMKLKKLFILAVVAGILCLSAGSTWAAAFIPGGSTLSNNLGSLPQIVVTGDPTALTSVRLTGSGDIEVDAGLFSTAGLSVGTSLLTGVALINNLTLTAQQGAGTFTPNFSTTQSGIGGGGADGTFGNPWGGNLSGSAAAAGSASLCPSPGACLGGYTVGLSGQIIIDIGLGALNPAFPLDDVGEGGQGSVSLGGIVIAAQGGPWITGKARVTNANTNVIVLPGRGFASGVAATLNPTTGETAVNVTVGGLLTTNPSAVGSLLTENTLTFSGTNNLTSGGAGTVTFISPTLVNTGGLGLGNVPGVWRLQFKFVPEPGTVLLLVSGAAGLAFIGRRRMKG